MINSWDSVEGGFNFSVGMAGNVVQQWFTKG